MLNLNEPQSQNARLILDHVIQMLNSVRAQDRAVVVSENRLLDILEMGISPEELTMAFEMATEDDLDVDLFHPEQTLSETAGRLVLAGITSIKS